MVNVLVLTIYDKNNQKKRVLLNNEEYIIGRDNTCTVCLADTEVSRRHVRLCLGGSGKEETGGASPDVTNIVLEDLGSLNGTFVNGHQIKNYHLQVGDRIQIGGTLLVLELISPMELEEQAQHLTTDECEVEDVSGEVEACARQKGMRILSRTRTRDFLKRRPQEDGCENSILDTSTGNSFFDSERFSSSGIGVDSVDITMSSSEDQILKTISHTEGEKFLANSRCEKVKDGGVWTSRAQGFLHLLYEMTLSISHCMDIDRLSNEILDMIFRWVDADRGCILLFDSNTNKLIPRAKKMREEYKDEKLIISKTILDYVLEHREGVLTSNAQADVRWEVANSVLSVGIHEAICVPLQGRYGIVGAIYLDTFSRSDGVTNAESPRFGDEYLKLMITIAHHVAIAVEDTRYYRGMLQAERLAAIGQTVATLSHHIKNILQGIQGGSYLIQTGLELHNETFTAKGWKIVERNQNRISALIMDMLTFSKERKPELVKTNINQIVGEVVELMMDRAVKANIVLLWQPDTTVPDSLVDPEAINHAILNLVTNAIDAVTEMMENDKKNLGTLQTVRMDQEDSESSPTMEVQSVKNDAESVFADGSHIFSELEDADELTTEEDCTNGSGVNLPGGQIDILTQYDAVRKIIRISVKDTGSGLTKEQAATIFRPFESSKGNKGTGLGLPVCKKIVREHGGTIHVEPRKPHGSRFIITLPVVLDLD